MIKFSPLTGKKKGSIVLFNFERKEQVYFMISRANASCFYEFAFSSGQGYYYYPLVNFVLETDRRLASYTAGG